MYQITISSITKDQNDVPKDTFVHELLVFLKNKYILVLNNVRICLNTASPSDLGQLFSLYTKHRNNIGTSGRGKSINDRNTNY